MLAIEVNFLTGRFVAAAHHDRNSPEWPPHPARMFSALVATWADTDDPDLVERQAVEWLEAQPPPSIRASEATPRTSATHFVPVNDARVFSGRSYNTRARKVQRFLSQLDKSRARGDTKKKIRSLDTQLRKQRNVSSMVSKVGTTNVKSAVDLMPPGWLSTSGHVRTGQARVYPSVTPIEPRVTYMWDAEPADDIRTAIDGLCSRLTRLGHSSSLISCRVAEDYPRPSHIPGNGAHVMRSVRSGQLAALEGEYEKHRGIKPRTLPFTPVRYTEIEPVRHEDSPLVPDTSADWMVFAFLPPYRKFPSTRSVEIAKALRGAVLHHADEPIPEGVSGHRKDGTPSTRPHVAFLPLPWVGHEHSDGRLMGAAMAIPRTLDPLSRRAAVRAVGIWESSRASERDPLVLTLGRGGVIKMDRVVTGVNSLVTLRSGLWRRPSRRWVSATPVALPTHPGRLGSGTVAARAKAWARAEHAIVVSCHHIGLPAPTNVVVSLSPLLAGARPAPGYSAFHQSGRGGRPIARKLVHAAVTFDRQVSGPVILGAGRYLGLGLMRPLADAEKADE